MFTIIKNLDYNVRKLFDNLLEDSLDKYLGSIDQIHEYFKDFNGHYQINHFNKSRIWVTNKDYIKIIKRNNFFFHIYSYC